MGIKIRKHYKDSNLPIVLKSQEHLELVQVTRQTIKRIYKHMYCACKDLCISALFNTEELRLEFKVRPLLKQSISNMHM